MTAKWILSLIFLITSNVFAYNFTDDFNNGFYWNTMPINFAVSEPNQQAGSFLKAMVEDAVDEWESSLGQQLWDIDPTVLAVNPGNRNLIRWSSDIEGETGHNAASTLAVTLRYINGPYYYKSEIILNAQHPTLGTMNGLKSTLMHEFGHTYGLGHSNNNQAIMYFQYTGSQILANDDLDGMSALVAETQRRLAIGYISPLAFEEEGGQTTSCATVDINPDSGGGPGGPFSILFSLVLGLLMFSPVSTLKRKTLPIQVYYS